MQSRVDMSKMQSKVDMTIRGTAPVAPGRMLNKVDMTIRGPAPVAPGIRGTSPAPPALNRLTMMTSGVPTKAAVTAVSTFGMGPSTIGGMPGMAPLAPALQEPGEQQGEMLVVHRQEQEVERQPEAGDRRQRMEMERKGNVYLQICIGGTGAVALGLLLLILILPKGQLPTSAITTDLSETDYPTPPVTTTTTTTTTTTPTTTVTTTLPPAGPPEIACFYDISNVQNKRRFAWSGANICKDIHVHMTVLPNGILATEDITIYWQLTLPNDHVYFMYLWEEIHEGRDLRGLKNQFDNRKRRYSLGWLNSTHVYSVARLQAFVDVFKSDTTEEDSGISLGLDLNEDKIKNTRELLSMIGTVSPKFTVLLIKLEDHGGKTCQLFPYSKKNKIQELTNAREWPAPVALPVTAAIYTATRNASGDVCVSSERSRSEQWYCSNTTDDSVFTTKKGKMFAAENRKSLKELKHQYRHWRTPRICILNMEYFYFPQFCMTRNETDLIF